MRDPWFSSCKLTTLFAVDLFEVCVLIGACFIVNYVTADSKTNWAEGVAMVSFYIMIVGTLRFAMQFLPLIFVQALCSWFYTGQTEVNFMSSCESVAAAIASGGET